MFLGKFGKKDDKQAGRSSGASSQQAQASSAVVDPPPSIVRRLERSENAGGPGHPGKSPKSTSPPSSLSFPPAPNSIEETGLPTELLIQLLVKTLFTVGELTEASAGDLMKLSFSVMKELFGILQQEKLAEIRGHGEPLGAGIPSSALKAALRIASQNRRRNHAHHRRGGPAHPAQRPESSCGSRSA